MTIAPLFRRVLSAAVAASLVILSPGLASYAAAAEVVRLDAAGAAQGPRAFAVPLAGSGSSLLAPSPLSAPSLSAGFLPVAAPSAFLAAPVLAAPSAAASLTPAAAALVTPAAAPALIATPAVRAAAADSEGATPFRAAQREVAAALESAGDLTAAAPSGLRGLGERLEAALTGAPALNATGEVSAAPSYPMGDGSNLARPAGDSIRQAAEAHDGPIAAPPSPRAKPRAPKGPFWPKLLAAGLALVPAYFIGLPLIAAGSLILGGLTIAGGVSLAAMPFLGENAPKVLRALPGAVVGGLGVAAVASGLIVPGLFAAVGGWGLVRYGLGRSSVPRYESATSLTAYFGGIAALTTAALAASGPAGWLALGAKYIAYPVAALLWLHLPSWVGEGMSSSFEGVWLSAKGVSRVLTAVHRDTVLLDRLQNFSERQWRASKWNAVWLSLIWTPVVLVEAAKRILAAVVGIFVGAVTAPVMFLWGASFKLLGPGKTSTYFAEAARFVFDKVQNGKAGLFNPLEAKVLPYANSDKFFSRAGGSLALTVLQFGWLVYALIATPFLALGGLLTAFGKTGTYDAARHSPSSLRINSEDSPGAKPTDPTQPAEPTTPVQAPFAPKLIAAALALAPALFFGAALFLLPTTLLPFGFVYAALSFPLAAMPFMGPNTPRVFTAIPSVALAANGLLLLLTGSGTLIGLLALAGSWGFWRYAKERNGKAGRFDDAAELGAFFGALGTTVGVGAAWMGLTGPWGLAALGLALVTNPFLLMHLPEWVGYGLLGSLRGIPVSMHDYALAFGFWHEDTKFLTNLKKHADYWLKKTYWNGVWLSVLWVPTGLVMAAEYALAGILGLIAGIVRAPLAFLAAATKHAKPYSRASIFFGEALDGWRKSAEGSKAFLDALVAPFKSTIDESSPVTGRPTFKAAAALLGARFAQLGWLIADLIMSVTGLALVVGLARGAKAAFAKPHEYRLYLPGIRIDAPLNGANARTVTDTYWTERLDPFFKELTADFDREGVAYDAKTFVKEQVNGHGVNLAGDGSDKRYVTMFIVFTLTAQQAAVAKRHIEKLENAPQARF